MKPQYAILTAPDNSKLAEVITCYLCDGWQLAGGVSIDPKGFPHQAIVKIPEPWPTINRLR